jgi:DNA-binding HxlR family transcriptional regulator
MEPEVTRREPATFQECQREIVPMADVLQQIAGKWTIFIIGELSHGPRRFSELKRKIEGVSQKMLTATLRDLEKDGLVTRTVTPSIPPRVDYELTAMGRELRTPLRVIGQWAHANRERVTAARQRYEENEAARRAEGHW